MTALKAAVAAARFAFSLHILTFIHSFSMSVSQPASLIVYLSVSLSFIHSELRSVKFHMQK